MGYDEKSLTGEEEVNMEHDTITLTFEDGSECECIVWGFVDVDGQSYISLLPMEQEDDDEDAGCYLYQYDEDENGAPILGFIEDDEILDKVVAAFDKLFDEEEAEYDEIVPEENL